MPLAYKPIWVIQKVLLILSTLARTIFRTQGLGDSRSISLSTMLVYQRICRWRRSLLRISHGCIPVRRFRNICLIFLFVQTSIWVWIVCPLLLSFISDLSFLRIFPMAVLIGFLLKSMYLVPSYSCKPHFHSCRKTALAEWSTSHLFPRALVSSVKQSVSGVFALCIPFWVI